MARRAVADSKDLPIGLQVAALPWQEELCLRFMLELEEAFGFKALHHTLRPVARPIGSTRTSIRKGSSKSKGNTCGRHRKLRETPWKT